MRYSELPLEAASPSPLVSSSRRQSSYPMRARPYLELDLVVFAFVRFPNKLSEVGYLYEDNLLSSEVDLLVLELVLLLD